MPHALDGPRLVLRSLGFALVEQSDDTLLALTQVRHGDLLLTRVTYVLLVRRVAELTPALLERDQAELSRRLPELARTRSRLRSVAVLATYLAERVSDEARAALNRAASTGFGRYAARAALDQDADRITMTDVPFWGAPVHQKLQFLALQLLSPRPVAVKWPTSRVGILLGLLSLWVVLSPVCTLLRLVH